MKKILSKEEFVKYINKIKDTEERLDKLYDILGVWPGEYDLSLSTECANLLSFIMNDDDSKFGTWISWWLWETTYGQDGTCNMIWEAKNSKQVERVIDTPEKLYDLLVENINEREEEN